MLTFLRKNSRSAFTCLALVATAVLAGCDTFDSRAKEKAGVFNSLPATTQDRLEKRAINVGDTEDMVYIALGDADEKRNLTNANGSQQVWIYRTYWQEYQAWSGSAGTA